MTISKQRLKELMLHLSVSRIEYFNHDVTITFNEFDVKEQELNERG